MESSAVVISAASLFLESAVILFLSALREYAVVHEGAEV
jgi:hypothetical protein